MKKLNAKDQLEEVFNEIPDLQIKLVGLLAKVATWCHPCVVCKVNQNNQLRNRRYKTGGVWFPGTARGKKTRNGARPQRNEKARKALANALPYKFAPKEFSACHVWPNTSVNEQNFTALANLVMLPRALESLTDHASWPWGHRYLQWKAYQLFKWMPKGCKVPKAFISVGGKRIDFEKLEKKFKVPTSDLTKPEQDILRKVLRRRSTRN